MSVVHVNSISGITSITAPSSSDVLTLHTSNNAERLRINSSGNVLLNGGSFRIDGPGEFAVYESDTSLAFNNSAQISLDFSSNVARLRSTANGTGTNRPLALCIGSSEFLRITSGGSVLLGGGTDTNYYSSNLVLTCGANAGGFTIRSNATSDSNFITFADASSSPGYLAGGLKYSHSDDTLVFRAGAAERVEVQSAGHLKINDGDLIIGTAGHGIDFSAQTATSATGATTGDELLDHYEEGAWTPVLNKSGDAGSVTGYTAQKGRYIRCGDLLWISFYIYKASGSFGSLSNQWYISGLPFGLEHQTNGAYQFIPAGYFVLNGVNQNQITTTNRWQSNSTNGNATLTVYGNGHNTNWTSGSMEMSATGVLRVA